VDEGLGSKFWFGMVGVILACTVGAVLVFLLISGAWWRWGAIGAFIFFGGVLMLVSWIFDRKKRKEWEADDE
jgi:hypothetical protein